MAEVLSASPEANWHLLALVAILHTLPELWWFRTHLCTFCGWAWRHLNWLASRTLSFGTGLLGKRRSAEELAHAIEMALQLELLQRAHSRNQRLREEIAMLRGALRLHPE